MNPLLDQTGPPRFDEIRAEHVGPAVAELIRELEAELEQIEERVQPSWEDLVEPLERLGDRLGFSWGLVGHLMAVRNSEELRAAYEEVQPQLVAFSMRVAQSRAIYDSYRQAASRARAVSGRRDRRTKPGEKAASAGSRPA